MTAMTSREDHRRAAEQALVSAYEEADRSNPYDVFFWFEDGEQRFISVPWASSNTRANPVKKLANGAWTNTDPLPNGMPAESATYAGSIYVGDPPTKN